MSNAHHDAFDKATKAGFIIALGIVYGDIGTSPLYTMQSLVDNQGGLSQVSEAFILGSVSLIIWTLTLVTTIKYVLIALKADNHHEGGIFSLFTLVRRMSRWLIIPAMLGGATLLSDGALTPAVTVTSAIEGLKAVPELSSIYQNQTNVILTTLLILMVLFGLQRFGTGVIGKLFGPVMLVWFSVLGISGLLNSLQHLEILKAINPYYALHLLVSPENHRGIFILGSIFLATTGAEALYSDLGHVGRGNIYASWPFVKVCIILSYCGQAAWILAHKDSGIALNPFFASVPEGLRVYLVILATLAAIIASQALISGSFTLVSEAMRLKIFPLFKITYPGANLGQLYIPVINWSLFAVTSCTVLYFRTSAHMEAAYGLAITITMLMTTILLAYYLIKEGVKPLLASLLMAFFAFIEFIFFLASAVKFMHGGYVVVVLALAIVFVMVIWHAGTMIVAKYVKSLSLNDYKHQIKLLRDDLRFDLYQTNVVYLTNRMKKDLIDRSILYSILDKRPKRAQVYWFVNVRVTDEPYTATYKVDMLETDYIVCVELYLGFRMPQTVPRYLRTIVQDLMESGRLPKQAQDYTITPGREVGDFRFVIIEERVSHARQLSTLERFVMQTKASIKHVTASPMRWFGLQYSEATVEVVPLLLSDVLKLPIKEIKACTKDEKA
ncbi:KUP/HAK/KT family potassium transporter [Streptococcus equi]|uniref:Probable potassium transport system protein Kup n=4 Tax=Bacillota TaxID=1239 RepID=KUP_STRE4|nr:KUP/HAK/KT family potassium transporter [Streptococcus equi]C0M958.1 RecName: Full=Probable potassium transport system protein Kup [Streptococcus equi subsp. equi 4047]ASB96289.1 potassium transporter Kup [Streptococcus equi subsp. equi]MBT1197661.1 potassium transporter Kup [Streptococcus equi subsp. equi]MBT1198606.1 potassium transporter Kup [Streptococcus equi subsp. equi]MBT1218830.1 potassium transporter Kup [Streptococcus equi subsp. equi]MBT1222776.1 potassium transporter Kup [Stre